MGSIAAQRPPPSADLSVRLQANHACIRRTSPQLSVETEPQTHRLRPKPSIRPAASLKVGHQTVKHKCKAAGTGALLGGAQPLNGPIWPSPERFLVAVGICTYTVCDSAMKSRNVRFAARAAAAGLPAGDALFLASAAALAVAAPGCGLATGAAAAAGEAAAMAGLHWKLEAAGAGGRKLSRPAAMRGCSDGGSAFCALSSVQTTCRGEATSSIEDRAAFTALEDASSKSAVSET